MAEHLASERRAVVWDFTVGDRALVYDDDRQQWIDDGEVLEVADAGVRVRFAAGSSTRVLPPDRLKRLEPVVLHVYDLGRRSNGVRTANSILRRLGAGAYHTGVEVYGREYTFGDARKGCPKGQTGVFGDEPRHCPAHRYRESVPMGYTELSRAQVRALLQRLQCEWLAEDYDFSRRNCCSFSDSLCRQLGLQHGLPSWITKVAHAAGSLENVKEKGKKSRGAERSAHYRPGDFMRGIVAMHAQAANEAKCMRKKAGDAAQTKADRRVGARIRWSRVASQCIQVVGSHLALGTI